MKQNAMLQARVNELELELGVWKHAHSVVVEASERDAKAHNVQLATLNRQIAQSDTFAGVRDTVSKSASVARPHDRRPESKSAHSLCHRRR
jgi:hypothetical protein